MFCGDARSLAANKHLRLWRDERRALTSREFAERRRQRGAEIVAHEGRRRRRRSRLKEAFEVRKRAERPLLDARRRRLQRFAQQVEIDEQLMFEEKLLEGVVAIDARWRR